MADEEKIAGALSREDLYELVWSKPMLDLAKDFGISDVALAKRCRRLAIPVPGRGYWARVDAGQKPYRPKLPKREPQYGDQHALTVQAQEPDDRAAASETPETCESLSTIEGRIAALPITSADSIMDCLAAVKRTARQFKHARRAEFVFDRGEKTGPVVSMDVSDAVLDRACVLADRVLKACESLGWSFVAPERERKADESARPHGRHGSPEPQPANLVGQILVADERVGLHIEERLREEKREPTAAELAREKREYKYHAPRKTHVPTGNLRVVRLDTYRSYGTPARLTWYDRGGTRVEERLPDILAGFYELALSIKARRAEDERQERVRQEAERRREELEARQEANAALIKQLETDAGAWHRARYLRRYIRAARKALGTSPIQARFHDHHIDYLDWAEAYIDQLDPLTSRPRSLEFSEHNAHFMSDLDRIKAAFGRLLGSEWAEAWKFGADYSPDPTRRYYYSRSVFEVENADDETVD